MYEYVRIILFNWILGGIYKETKNEKAVIPDNKMIKTYSNQKRKTLGNGKIDLLLCFAF